MLYLAKDTGHCEWGLNRQAFYITSKDLSHLHFLGYHGGGINT